MASGDSESAWQDEFLCALGELLISSNYLEEALVDVLWVSSRLDEITLIQTVRGKTLGQLLRIVLDKYRTHIEDPELLEKLVSAESELQRAVTLRNEFVHADWVFAEGEVERTRRPRSGEVVERIQRMTTVEVRAAIAEIDHAVTAAEDLYDATQARVPRGEVPPRGGIVREDGTYVPGLAKRVTD